MMMSPKSSSKNQLFHHHFEADLENANLLSASLPSSDPYNSHRTKRPMKSALKKSTVRPSPNLHHTGIATPSSLQLDQPSSISTSAREKSISFSPTVSIGPTTTTTPSPKSSSFTRRQYNMQRRHETNDDDSWRKDGKEIRKKLIEEDDATCGNGLVINKNRNLAKYCGIADRVQDQFQIMYEAGDKLEEAFIMGNRLIKFLSEVLPTHDHYYVDSKHRPDLAKLRIQTQNNLLKVRKQMEDVAYAFDKEIYKIEMEKQGLEFDSSPGRIVRDRRTKRKKIVKFAVEDDEHHDCEYRFAQQKEQAQSAFENHDTMNQPFKYLPPKSPKKKYQESDESSSFQVSTFSDSKFDLSLWEERDPGMEIVDMSFSSGDNSSGTDDQSSFEDSAFQVEDGISSPSCANQHFEGKVDDNHSNLHSHSKQIEVDLFNPEDEDGWESVKDTPESSFDWPDLEGLENQQLSIDNHGSSSHENVELEGDDNLDLVARDERSKDHDDDVNTDIGDETSEHSSDFEGINDSLDMLLEENVSFVEKIALENINSSINELRDFNDEDSDAADSWEQNDDAGDQFLDNKEDDHCRMDLSLDNEVSMATCDTTNSSDAADDIEPQSVHSSVHDEHLVALQQEFMSSFDLDDDQSEEEYEKDGDQNEDDDLNISKIDYVDELTTCDSYGADKTVVTSSTAETEAMTADDGSESSDSSDSSSEHDDAIIGISKRDDYYPSFDSPQRPDESGLSRRLDDVEDRIEDLQVVKHENRERTLVNRTSEEVSIQTPSQENDCVVSSGVTKHLDYQDDSKYPIQMPRVAVNVESEGELENMDMNTQQQSKIQPKSQHYTATGTCRLKNIRQTQAWRRRYR